MWFAVRREWRSLGLALGVTAVLAVTSFAVAPDAWFEWIALLARNAHQGSDYVWLDFVPEAPLAVRVALAAVLVAWGARRDLPWTLAVAMVMAQPDINPWTFALLAAIPRSTIRAEGAVPAEQLPNPLVAPTALAKS